LSLSPFILLGRHEKPISFEEAIYKAYGDELNEMIFSSNIPFAEEIHETIEKQGTLGLTRDETLAIYFYTLEWVPKREQSLYKLLNKILSHLIVKTKHPNGSGIYIISLKD